MPFYQRASRIGEWKVWWRRANHSATPEAPPVPPAYLHGHPTTDAVVRANPADKYPVVPADPRWAGHFTISVEPGVFPCAGLPCVAIDTKRRNKKDTCSFEISIPHNIEPNNYFLQVGGSCLLYGNGLL